MRQMKSLKIGMKELIALKLYLDHDDLQHEFRKCFRSQFDTPQRLRSFYHWNRWLIKTFAKLNKLNSSKRYETLYHGVSNVTKMGAFDGKCFGPLSTTTDIGIARAFAGNKGMILQIKPNYKSGNRPFDVQYLSAYPDECEVLCFNQSFDVEDVILSTDYDAKPTKEIMDEL